MNLSIIIPFNKDRGWLSKAIESVEKQTEPCELILSKSDNTCAVNLARGLDQVKTEYYAVLAEDDYLHPHFAERMLKGIGDAAMSFSDAWRIDPKGNTKLWRSAYHGHNDLLGGTLIHGGAVMYHTETVRRLGGYDETLTTAEEYDLHLRMSFNGCKFAYVGYPLYYYRLHGDNKSKITRANRSERKTYINQIRDRYR
jgi:GT2 family glycosyltransferase